MNKEIELHDSDLSKIIQEGTNTCLCLDQAIVHHSAGKPGIDEGTCWTQKIHLIFKNSSLEKKPDDIPNTLDYGWLSINGNKYNNMFPVSLNEEGIIIFSATTLYGKELYIKARGIEIELIGEENYLQDFPGN